MAFEKGITPEGAKPFKSGQSGNPNGRPRKLPSIDKMLSDILGSEEDTDSEAHAVLRALLLKAKKGDTKAAEILLDRAYGKAKQVVDNNIKVTEFNIKDVIGFKE